MIRVRAPASIANLGPGFDCAAVAVQLWNELRVESGHGVEISGEDAELLPRDLENLVLRAFSLIAPTRGLHFSLTSRIPIGRGLGSSAAAVALGLVAGSLATGRSPSADELLPLGTPLEGHADNLAAALVGGICLSWDGGHFSRVADDLPLVPLAVLPEERLDTERGRQLLPPSLPFADATHTVGRATMLGAALVSGNPLLFEAALSDRLHEPYRSPLTPLLPCLQDDLPPGAAGVTLAGSGSAVIVWARPGRAQRCRAALEERDYGRVLSLRVARRGACYSLSHHFRQPTLEVHET